MSEMIERVARALHQSTGKVPARYGGVDLNSWDALLPRERSAFLTAARAAIEEMRTPTEAMENAAWSVEGAMLAWEDMIDAALRDREGNGTERPQVSQPFRDEQSK